MTDTTTLIETLKPVDSTEIASLIAQGKGGEIVSRMAAYEAQQKRIASGELKMQRVCCKPNKNGNLYVQHPSIPTNKNDMNFSNFIEPAVKAIATNPELLAMVQEYYFNGKHVQEVRILPTSVA